MTEGRKRDLETKRLRKGKENIEYRKVQWINFFPGYMADGLDNQLLVEKEFNELIDILLGKEGSEIKISINRVKQFIE